MAGLNALFDLDIGRVNHVRPFQDIDLDAGGELIWRTDNRVESQRR